MMKLSGLALFLLITVAARGQRRRTRSNSSLLSYQESDTYRGYVAQGITRGKIKPNLVASDEIQDSSRSGILSTYGEKFLNCFALPTIQDSNIDEIAEVCKRSTRIGGMPFKTDSDNFSQHQVQKFFAGKTRVDMCIRIRITAFKELDLSSIEEIRVHNCGGSAPPLVIQDNYELEKLYLSPKLTIISEDPDHSLPLIRIQGNPKLKDVHVLKIAFKKMKTEILEHGECVIDEEIKSFKQIKYCKILSGDVNLSETIEPEPPDDLALEEIRGCLKINGTKLETLEFLKKVRIEMKCKLGVHVISNNKNLCVGKMFLNDVYFDVQNNMHPSCETACKAVPVTAEKISHYQDCKTVLGNVEIKDWKKDESDLVNVFSQVEEIYGQLILVNTKVKSTTELFKSLRIVENTESKGPALIIEGNRGLKSIELKSLERIHSEEEPSVVIDQPRTKMTLETYYKLRYQTFGEIELNTIIVSPEKGGLIVNYVVYGVLLILVNIFGFAGFIYTFLRLRKKNFEDEKKTKLKLRTPSQITSK